MIYIGINGFGRIGKCVFLQLLENPLFQIQCINTFIKVTDILDYLLYDSTHHYSKNFDFEILNDKTFRINQHKVTLISSREGCDWRSEGCEYIIDATGAFLTLEKASKHKVDFLVMSAPAKDETPVYIYGVNDFNYHGEPIVSGSSCTTNCISPLLKLIDDNFSINHCVFTTIHSTTASQNTVDVIHKNLRTHRTILNNIIPHTTGASSNITKVLPNLVGKVFGTSLRVPVLNCSLCDINVDCQQPISLDDVKNLLYKHSQYKNIYNVCEKNLVSCDFLTTTTPTILDVKASISTGISKCKLMVWYDNEWSYSAQLIRLVTTMYRFNSSKILSKYLYTNLHLKNQKIVLRLDLNVPINKLLVVDDFRIQSCIPTIKTILDCNPKYILLTSHLGRPNGKDSNFSLLIVKPLLEKYLERTIVFLPDGINDDTRNLLETSKEQIFLLENLRFHPEETNYIYYNSGNEIIDMYKSLGDVFINDAFGCLHRKHMSIYAMKDFKKPYGYGGLIEKELETCCSLTKSNLPLLCIIGGNKIADKLPLIQSFQQIPNAIVFVTGGLAKQYQEYPKHNIVVMKDGYGPLGETQVRTYIPDINNTDINVYDIGDESLEILMNLVKKSKIIFWNGTLGWIEHENYAKGSLKFVEFLEKQSNKEIIIGGGETASLIKNKNHKHFYVSTGGGALMEYLQEKINWNKNIVGLEIYE